jgi:hypothetical protein
VINGAFHSQGYKDALFPVTIEGQLLDLGMIMLEEDEILTKEFNSAFRK